MISLENFTQKVYNSIGISLPPFSPWQRYVSLKASLSSIIYVSQRLGVNRHGARPCLPSVCRFPWVLPLPPDARPCRHQGPKIMFARAQSVGDVSRGDGSSFSRHKRCIRGMSPNTTGSEGDTHGTRGEQPEIDLLTAHRELDMSRMSTALVTNQKGVVGQSYGCP